MRVREISSRASGIIIQIGKRCNPRRAMAKTFQKKKLGPNVVYDFFRSDFFVGESSL